ncbi:hypothetical protein NX779_03605 [Mycoplasma cottewii]|uniref:tRNA-binding domain-containing protein n=1 Tax=Mycoplasma cottewii TaxID=51364 RepID=A0ABY5U0P9_9MOLU|nr:hypothetical protein [Mycoplasma cottewii]UWD34869.1 hypothetical protein NX779_03605 [Mycoplasma cottewii]
MNSLKFGVFYNKQFDTLLVSFSDKPATDTEIINNVVVLKNKNQVVGVNIFEVSKDIQIKDSFCSEKQEVVEYVENVLKDIYPVKQEKQFLIGKILSCKAIEGTHLHLCEVDIKQEVLQIVCGASNARKGLAVVVATSGSWMPNGSLITEGKVKGIDSFGMLCSARELKLEKESQGIIELGSEYSNKIGQSFWGVYYDEQKQV